MSGSKALALFEGYGIELEYMIVDQKTLEPMPICDQVLRSLAGHDANCFEMGDVAWSNELAMHVIELKCNGPHVDPQAIHQSMQAALINMKLLLKTFGAMLLPSAMHPTFDPEAGELKLWSHENAEIYASYDRIFGCKGHGWGNLQSVHINLPFADDDEFDRLHTAIRLILPLLPALAASSPYVEGERGPCLDSRLHFYLANQRRIPSILGDAIPEPVRSRSEYEAKILAPMYRDIAPFDPKGELKHEWLNSRAAIARFDRSAIEIRILDIQECLQADFALITGVIGILKHLCAQSDEHRNRQRSIPQAVLKSILLASMHAGTDVEIKDQAYVSLFESTGSRIADVCRSWIAPTSAYYQTFSMLVEGNSLSTRLLRNCGSNPDHSKLIEEYSKLSDCLINDELYDRILS